MTTEPTRAVRPDVPIARRPSVAAPPAVPAPRPVPAQRAEPAPRPRPEVLLAPGEVAAMFGVDAKTVSRWERTGRLTCVRTLGGHRRFPKSQVEQLLARTRTQRTD